MINKTRYKLNINTTTMVNSITINLSAAQIFFARLQMTVLGITKYFLSKGKQVVTSFNGLCEHALSALPGRRTEILTSELATRSKQVLNIHHSRNGSKSDSDTASAVSNKQAVTFRRHGSLQCPAASLSRWPEAIS